MERIANFIYNIKLSLPRRYRSIAILLVSLFIIIIWFYNTYFFAPKEFPINSIYTVEQGEGVKEVAEDLKNLKIIKSARLFVLFTIIQGGEKDLKSGDYFLEKKISVLNVSNRMINGDYHLEPFKLIIPEGLNVFELTDYVSEKLDKIDRDEFLELAKPKEGLLFPDTYFVLPNIKSEELIQIMEENFNSKTSDIKELMSSYKTGFYDVLKVASIIEEEAIKMEDKRMISGIIWNRLEIDMPLQVDASFKYVNGKTTFELTLDDLKTDSLYNTYENIGLPPTPIANPGLDSIVAALTPIDSDYLFYLTGHDGLMYYARTFDQHKINKNLYLR